MKILNVRYPIKQFVMKGFELSGDGSAPESLPLSAGFDKVDKPAVGEFR